MSSTVVHLKFDPERWQGLEPHYPLQSGPWVRIMLSRLPGDPLMAVLERADGALGFTGTVVTTPHGHESYNPWALLRRPEPVFHDVHSAGRVLPRLGDQPGELLPSVVLVAPGYMGDPVGQLAGQAEAVRECLTDIVDWARGEGASSVSVLYTSPSATTVLEPVVTELGGSTFPLTSRYTLPVTWSDWQEYVAGLPGDRKAEPNREIRRLSDSGHTVSGEEVEPVLDEIVAARCDHLTWSGQPADAAGERYRVASLVDAFGPDLMSFSVRRGGELLSSGLFLKHRRTLLRVYTATTEYGRQTPHAHVAATYYGPMGFVSQELFDVIDYGIGHGDDKRLHGCEELSLHGHVIPLR